MFQKLNGGELMAVVAGGSVALMCVTRVGLTWLGRRPLHSPEISQSLARIEDLVDATATEVEHLVEAERFKARLAVVPSHGVKTDQVPSGPVNHLSDTCFLG